MPTVSILIPAFKPDYLAQALESARGQTYTDIEILVGDDTQDGRLRPIVESVADPRIRYFHHACGNGLRNSQKLWERASGRYIKWLYDDDLLMPKSVEMLVGALTLHPEAALAFHQRVVIDGDNKIVQIPPLLIADGETALLSRRFLVEHMVAGVDNFIGEPSNVMMVRERIDPSLLMRYRGHGLDYLTDVAIYLSAAERRVPLVLVGGHYSCFRRHTEQNSADASPILIAGFYEWEFMVRGEAGAGEISANMLVKARDRLKQVYEFAIQSRGLKELEPLLANLNELTELPVIDLPKSPRFRAAMEHARTRIAR